MGYALPPWFVRPVPAPTRLSYALLCNRHTMPKGCPARGAAIAAIMKQKGMTLGAASAYVKRHGLWQKDGTMLPPPQKL